MQTKRIFLRSTLWYFIPFLIMTGIAIISQNYVFRVMQFQNYEIIRNQLLRDIEETEEEIYSTRKIALEMSMDTVLSKENVEEPGMSAINAFDRIGEYRMRLDICSGLFLAYSSGKVFDEIGSTRVEAYCSGMQFFTDESTTLFWNMLENRQTTVCVLDHVMGTKSLFLLYYFPAETYKNEKWIGFLIEDTEIEEQLESILAENDSHLLLTYGDQDFVKMDLLNKPLSETELDRIYASQGKGNDSISGYTTIFHQSKLLDLKLQVVLDNSVLTRNVRKEQVKILAISVSAFAVLSSLLWIYGRYQYKKSQTVQMLAVNMYPDMDRKDIRGGYELIQKVLERDIERLSYHDQMLGYFRKESKKQLTWLLLKSTPPEELQIEELMENCGIKDEGSYYIVLDFLLARGEGNLDFLEEMDKVLMYHLDKTEFGALLMVVVSLRTRDADHSERLALSKALMQKLHSVGYICTGITGGLVYEQMTEIHSSQEEAFSLLATLEKKKKSDQTNIMFFDEIAQMSKRVPHMTADVLRQFREALSEKKQEDALKALKVLLASPKEKTEELLTYVRYKVIQIMLDVWQTEGEAEKVADKLLHLIWLESNDFKIEVEKCIEIITAFPESRDFDEKEVLDYITEHALEAEISVNGVANHFGTSERSVGRIIKDNLNKTYKEYINELRMCRACELLNEGNLDIRMVAQQVGYYNVSSFNRLFKQMYGLTPGEYRARKHQIQ